MNCKGVKPLLSAYLDRELDGNEMLDIRTHLCDCEECRSELETIRSLKRLLGGLEAVEPPAYLEERLLANVLCARYVQPQPRRIFAGALLFAGVTACSMFITLLLMSNSVQPQSVVHSRDTTIPFEIQRDQALSVGGDPLGGAPLITAAAYGGR